MAKDFDYKGAVINALIVNCIYRKEHDEDAQLAVAELVAYETKLVLDPAVSSEAAQLQVISPAIERKVASILLALEKCANEEEVELVEIKQILDHADVAEWLTRCRNKGYGNANVFTIGG